MTELFTTADQLPEQTKRPDLMKLDFHSNWNNKLDGIAYTTFRMANPGRYRIGAKFGIYLNGKYHHDAEVILVKTLLLIPSDQTVIHEGKRLAAVNEWVARIDTGYSLETFIGIVEKMYKNKPINFETQKWNLVLLRKLDHK